MSFEVKEVHELLALFRAVVEAKFQSDPVDDDLPASSVLAAVATRLQEELIAAEVTREGPAAQERWREWIQLGPERREWKAAMAYASRVWCTHWPSWSKEVRDQACRALLSPFITDSGTLDCFEQALEEALLKHH